METNTTITNPTPCILIVDSQPENVLMLKKILSDSNRLFVQANSVKEALDIISKQQINLILIDVELLEKDFLESETLLKTKHIPKIIITPIKNQITFSIDDLDENIIDYLFKPFNTEITIAKVATLLHLYNQGLELENKNNELTNTLLLLAAAQQQLIQQEKLASLGALTAGIAHEIKNPLNFVTNFAELSIDLLDELKTATTNEDREEILNLLKDNNAKINYHGKRADSIVKNMLEHSRTGKGEKQLTDLNNLSDEFLNLAYHGMRANAPDFNCVIKKELDSNLPKINIVSQEISRVLLNLFNNAFYAVKEKSEQQRELKQQSYQPEVDFSTSLNSNKIILKIRDNGNGIPDKIKKKIFQPFFTTKPTGEGTGLGLSLSHDIIKAHNGEIKVESKENDFTEFTVTLPL